jgi:hypothetical protein
MEYSSVVVVLIVPGVDIVDYKGIGNKDCFAVVVNFDTFYFSLLSLAMVYEK